ncbi:hypothetical protein CBS147323_9155 [Aspergillus niger]|nr:hypothetical protein CBS147323_9155 [Aspergillus niger]KAI3016713.1 hypothetical protein CBS147347_10693 [Aspergillus niger]
MSLRVFGHENVIAAARKRLYGENRWWVVDVYVKDPNEQPQRQTLHSHLVRSLREHFPNRRRPPDGLIYERIRFYKGKLGHPPDEQAEALWWAVLRHDPKSKNHVYLRAVLRHDPKSKNHVYLRAFLQYPSFPAAFDALLLIPGLWAKMQLGVLHTMSILSYLETISTVWMDRIFDGSNILSVHADAETVLALESQVPKLSELDWEYLRSWVMDDRTLFLLIDDSGTRAVLWERLKQINTLIPILVMFFQDLRFLDITSKVMKDLLLPLEDLGSKKTKKIIIDCELVLWRHFFWLADQHGFQIPAVAEFVSGQAFLPTPQTPEGLGSTEQDEAFQTFFRYLWDGAGINQATNAARESAATDGTAAVDQEMLNDELEHRMPSPSFSQILQISSPIDWSMAMWDCGMGSLEMPIGNLEVVVTIPNHNPRRISLPCDEMTINNFFNGLKER